MIPNYRSNLSAITARIICTEANVLYDRVTKKLSIGIITPDDALEVLSVTVNPDELPTEFKFAIIEQDDIINDCVD